MNPMLDACIEQYRQDIIEETINMIRISSVKGAAAPGMPFGTEIHRCLETVLALCQKLGFETKNCDGYVGYAQIGAGSELIGILVHLDVVPPGNGWTHPPFTPCLSNNRIYGRGAVDDKGPAIASIYALKALLDSGLLLTKRIRIIFGTDEENEWKCMEHYKQYEELPSCGFSPDAEFPVIFAEKGILYTSLHQTFDSEPNSIRIQSLNGGERANMVPDICSATLLLPDRKDTLSFKTTGITAHGSTPEQGKNAISGMMRLLSLISGLCPSQKAFIDIYQTFIHTETNGMQIFGPIFDEPSGSLVLNAGTIRMDEHSATLNLNIRYPVTVSGETIETRLQDFANKQHLQVDITLHSPPLYMEKGSPIIQTLLDTYHSYSPDASTPLAIGGGTYARSIPNAVAFGPIFPGEEELAHCPDEYIRTDDLILSAKIYADAIWQLISKPQKEE